MSSPKRILLAAVTALSAFLGLAAWAIASPVGAAPDDDFHLASIWCAWGDREGLCAPGEAANERTVPVRLTESSDCFAQDHTQSAQCPVDDSVMRSTSRGNFEGNYPPVFYATMGIFAGPDIALSTIMMRLLNAAIFTGAVTAVLVLLKPGQRGPLIWAATVTLVPLGVFIIPSVNPSSWAVLAGLTTWLTLYGYFTADARGRRIALGSLALVLGIMGAGARGDSAAYVAFAAAAASILSFRNSRSWMLHALLPLALVLVSSLSFLSAGQSTGIATASPSAEVVDTSGGDSSMVQTDTGLGLLVRNLMDLPVLWTGATGTWGLGWLDTLMPPLVWIGMMGLLFAIPFWGLRVMSVRKAIVLVLATVALAALPLYILQGKGLRIGEWVQPRYLLPLLALTVGVALFGFAKDHLHLTRLQTGAAFTIVTIANSLALHNNMRRYISGLGEGGFNLNASIEWWWAIPLQPMTVWFAGSLTFALTLLGLFFLLYPESERPSLATEDSAPSRPVLSGERVAG